MGLPIVFSRLNDGAWGYVPLRCQWYARFANGPAEGAAAYLSRDGEGKVGTTGLQFLRMKKFKKNGKKVLCRVIASERWKGASDLTRRAMNGRNEDQQEEPLPHRTEWNVRASRKEIEKHILRRWILHGAFVAVKLLDEVERGRKCDQDLAGSGEFPEFFAASIIAEFGHESGFQPADKTVAVRRGHHEMLRRLMSFPDCG